MRKPGADDPFRDLRPLSYVSLKYLYKVKYSRDAA